MSILLIHGVGGRARSWSRVLDELAPAVRRQAFALEVSVRSGQSVADVARELLRRHPGSHVIAGHSFGGMLAQEAALLDPSRVLGLVLVSTIPGTTPTVAAHNESLAADIEVRGIRTVAAEFAERLFAPSRTARDPDLKTDFVETMVQSGVPAVCAALRAITRWDASERLNAMRCPAEVICGDAEPDLDRQQMLATLLRAPFTVLDDTGHLAPLEAPDRVARVIERVRSRVEQPT
ncbi:alpha/beta fold hydrolase [Mycolicibacterium hodleri]|uniref:Alpha/beta hydrolase n=1 Tax=Mycolicibacterium hodleri TaxID=49897 RepID=A0A502EG22_9MYCO|nr:alpha/beta hydrolase [Mycolicibacterium hodleri]TPG36675.1 alpha/beta hydrolase [Mycolicibacterium hodleri]